MLQDLRTFFILKLIFKLSKDVMNINNYRPERILRTAPKVKMKIDFTDKERVRRSPYYLRNKLRNKIDSLIQLVDTMCEFSSELRAVNMSDL